MHVMREGILVLLGEQILLLRTDKIGAVDREQRLPLAHVLVGCVGEDLLNPSRKTSLDIRELLLIHVYIARHP